MTKARRGVTLLALLAISACATASARIAPLAEPRPGWDAIEVSSQTTPLRAPRYMVGPVRFAGGVALRSDDPRFGGLSDLRLDEAGGLVAVTDAGDLVTARLVLDAFGRLTGVDQVRLRRLTDLDGHAIRDKGRGDAEGLAVLPGGEFLVAFEREHRIWSYGREGAGLPVPQPHPAHAFSANEGMEGLVADGDGGWYVAGEGGGLWLCDRSGCTVRGAAPATALSGYRPTGLALDNQTGDLLMLERFYQAPIDTRMRVRRIDRDGRVKDELIALRLPATVDNFEGIATTGNPDGSLRIYIVSDDNFSPGQRTLLLAFDVASPPAGAAGEALTPAR